jgi:acetate kinase
MRILVFNCGSSSLKFELIEFPDQPDSRPRADSAGQFQSSAPRRVASGTFEEIGRETKITLKPAAGTNTKESTPVANHEAAAGRAVDWLEQAGDAAVDAVAHRIVHGGERVTQPVIATSEVMHALEEASQFAPLHNPPAIAAIKAVSAKIRAVPVVIVTDTGFHRTLPAHAYNYAIPRELAARHGIRRFGFHGIGHAWMLERCASLMGIREERLNLVTLHLGAGCSGTAIREGRSIDTSMGLTPLEGLMMATRSGDIDPAIFSFLAAREKIAPEQVERILNHESGLLGVSGISDDLREIEAAAAHDPHAALSIEMFCYRVRKYIGAYMAVLGRIDAIVFGGGIGEHSEVVRERVCAGLEHLKINLDTDRNRNDNGREACISAADSTVKIYVVPLDEELAASRPG